MLSLSPQPTHEIILRFEKHGLEPSPILTVTFRSFQGSLPDMTFGISGHSNTIEMGIPTLTTYWGLTTSGSEIVENTLSKACELCCDPRGLMDWLTVNVPSARVVVLSDTS